MSRNYARDTSAPRRLELGGEAVRVSKLTPRMLGELQAFIIDALENPYEAARDALAGLPEDEARAHWTAAVVEAQKTWPPNVDSDIGITLLSSPEGRGLLVWVCTRRHTKRMTHSRATALGAAMTAEEFSDLYALITPGAIGDLRNPEPASDGLPYAQVRAKLAERYGWSFDVIDDMTFDQIASAWHEGKPSFTLSIDPERIGEVTHNWRSYYLGLPRTTFDSPAD